MTQEQAQTELKTCPSVTDSSYSIFTHLSTSSSGVDSEPEMTSFQKVEKYLQTPISPPKRPVPKEVPVFKKPKLPVRAAPKQEKKNSSDLSRLANLISDLVDAKAQLKSSPKVRKPKSQPRVPVCPQNPRKNTLIKAFKSVENTAAKLERRTADLYSASRQHREPYNQLLQKY